LILGGMEAGELVAFDENDDGACHAGFACNQLGLLERQQHLMDAWRREAEEALDIGLCRRAAVDQRVGVDERLGPVVN
jgi:hypothetical protein